MKSWNPAESSRTNQLNRWCGRLQEGRFAFGIYIALITYFWWPALAHGQQMIFGDAAHHGLSLLAFLSEGLRNQRELLWESGIYGGHPLFAESQGGFVNPINLLCAWLFVPEYGIGVLRWLNMLVAGLGLYLLCKQLKLSRWCATFVCITTMYSSIWLSFQYNISVTGAMTWLPWLLAAVEYWLDRPTAAKASLIAIPAALIVFGGYPHLAYGAALYIGAYCIGLPLKADGRAMILRHWARLLSGATLAAVLAIGLSAIQLVPLLELVKYSHRNDGIGIQFGNIIPAASYLRGVFFFDWSLPQPLTSFGSLSSMTACLLAAIALILRPPARILAHGLAALFLFNLGVEYASPLFRLLYNHNLLPGLHSFRIMHPFFVLVALGASLLAGFGLHTLAQRNAGWWPLALVTTVMAIISIALYDPALQLSNFIAPTVILTTSFLLAFLKRLAWLPVVATLTISAEAIALRSNIWDFYDQSALDKTELVNKVLEDTDIKNFRVADYVDPLLSTFKLSNDPIHALGYRQILDSLSPFPSLRWGAPSINGVLALELGRRGMINEEIIKEAAGISSTPAGKRLIDQLGVKYISYASVLTNDDFELLASNPETQVFIHRNNAALPKIRIYSHALKVKSPEHALQLVREGHGDQLLVEGKVNKDETCGSTPTAIRSQKSRSTQYLIETEGDCPAWLFIADADYPGWRTYIDGGSAALYPANILGKAVHVPPGRHRVEVRFIPWSFYIGCVISAGALIALLAIALRRRPHE